MRYKHSFLQAPGFGCLVTEWVAADMPAVFSGTSQEAIARQSDRIMNKYKEKFSHRMDRKPQDVCDYNRRLCYPHNLHEW